jgi:hypothetical protein
LRQWRRISAPSALRRGIEQRSRAGTAARFRFEGPDRTEPTRWWRSSQSPADGPRSQRNGLPRLRPSSSGSSPPATPPPSRSVGGWVLPDLTEAAVHGRGDLEQVTSILGTWQHTVSTTGAPHLHVQLSCANALLADDATADQKFLLAMTECSQGWPFYAARPTGLRPAARSTASRHRRRRPPAPARISAAVQGPRPAPLRRPGTARTPRHRRTRQGASRGDLDRPQPPRAPDRLTRG